MGGSCAASPPFEPTDTTTVSQRKLLRESNRNGSGPSLVLKQTAHIKALINVRA